MANKKGLRSLRAQSRRSVHPTFCRNENTASVTDEHPRSVRLPPRALCGAVRSLRHGCISSLSSSPLRPVGSLLTPPPAARTCSHAHTHTLRACTLTCPCAHTCVFMCVSCFSSWFFYRTWPASISAGALCYPWAVLLCLSLAARDRSHGKSQVSSAPCLQSQKASRHPTSCSEHVC